MSLILHDVAPLWRLAPAPGHAKRDFLSLADLTTEEFEGVLALAADVKEHPRLFCHALEGRSVALAFEKPSLRTRVTFEVGAVQLGAYPVYLAPADIGLGKREPVRDVVRNLARWVDAVIVRTFAHSILEEMAAAASLPVINALSDLLHPCQAAADVMTLREQKGPLRGLKLAYVGDGNNVANALAQAAAKTGIQLTVACPPGYQPNPDIVASARADAELTGGCIRVVESPAEGVRDADAVYTDVWTSMGQEAESEKRRKVFLPYRVNRKLMALARPEALFLHCLPAHRDEEVTNEVLEGPQSVVLEQAENRLHVAKAVLLALLRESVQ